MLKRTVSSLIKRSPFLYNTSRMIRGSQVIVLDYPLNSNPRYGHGKPPHPQLYHLIDLNRNVYKQTLEAFSQFRDCLLDISLRNNDKPQEPYWLNPWFSGADAVALYALLASNKPTRYVEIGSGHSTKFARRAISDHGLPTKITSIDPHPRAEINSICDSIVRQPLEAVDPDLFEQLESGDILFVDGSHRCFMNSDVTVLFLDVLPRLKPGVLVHFHDIYLPYDYPPEWGKNFYSEQYLLSVYIMARDTRCEITMPVAFIRRDPELKATSDRIWDNSTAAQIPKEGASFWIKVS